MGFVFQHYALFRHMTVFENIAFGLRVRPRKLRPTQCRIRDRVRELLRLIQLGKPGGPLSRTSFPAASGSGWRWRARWPSSPRCCCWTSRSARWTPRCARGCGSWLRRLHDEMHVTSLFVTHDQEEALEVADRVVVMNHGRIEQAGTPDEVFHHPETGFVMDFLGR